jgi:two-component system, NtrC family, response regulator GlrR
LASRRESDQASKPKTMTSPSPHHGIFPSSPIMPEILTVDDEPDIGLALTDLLNQEGYAVTAVETGQAALDLSKYRHFQAVILDLGLPDRDGLEVLDQMRRRDPDLPIIILTAYSPLERYTGKTEGSEAFAYLSKPFDRIKLKDTIRRAIQYRVQKEAEKVPI